MPLNTPIDTRPTAGSNEAPDFAKQVADRLNEEYLGFNNTLAELEAEIPALPEKVSSDADALLLGALIKRFRDLDSRVEAVRVLEKEPYLRGGNAVDAHFFGLRDRIGKRNKNDRSAKPGHTDVLQARINVYQDEKIAAEQARLRAEREAAERAAREAARRAAEQAAAAEQARLAAERARTEHTRAAKQAAEEAAAKLAAAQQAEADRQAEMAEDARLATLAKPAEIARVRGNAEGGGGVTLTVAKQPYARLEDRSKLDMAKLWPFFTDDEIEKALRAWARSTGHRQQMDGAAIGLGNKGVTR